jgi:hypothetical protein
MPPPHVVLIYTTEGEMRAPERLQSLLKCSTHHVGSDALLRHLPQNRVHVKHLAESVMVADSTSRVDHKSGFPSQYYC